MSNVINLDDNNFAEEIYTTKKPVLVMFSANWCDNCKEFQENTFQKLLDNYSGKVKFAKVDVDESYELASKFQISKLPAFIIYKETLPVNYIIGNLPIYKFKEALEDLI